ncbi:MULTISPECIES: carbohydrate kinase family protein [Micrococcaceae]|uniref:carbohydrate kinase family protein n=1 Tax=Micrococcaceae TaxID=1268 RepID=UPI0006FD3671|nr:carbohydrate kinase [Arthrobacter sp. Soil761]KRE75138.1 carbohydrate kinase [Arthrobacter sp. Soil761]
MPTPSNAPDFAAGGPLVTVIGESLIDVIDDPHWGTAGRQEHPGGSPLNVAVGTARLGLSTSLVTHYDDDAHGLMIERHLQSNGIASVRGGAARTSTATATLGRDGAATYAFDVTWDINGAAIPALAAVEASTHVHTGSIAAVLSPGEAAVRNLIESARSHATVSFDPNCRPALTPDHDMARRQVEEFVAASDIVKASDEDLSWLYPDRAPEESLAAWLDLGPAVAALTRGADGPVLLTCRDRVELPGWRIDVADTVGAGDSFMAALISGLAQLDALGAAARPHLAAIGRPELTALAAYANRAAAITCSRPGANPPSSDELDPITSHTAGKD